MQYLNKIIFSLFLLLPQFASCEEVMIDNKIPATYNVASKSSGTVIVAHGCYGITGRETYYASVLTTAGFNTVVVDSWAYRGMPSQDGGPNSVCQTYKVTGAQRLDEIYKTVKWIKQQPWHSGKIFLLGYSHGGILALEVSRRPLENGIDKVVAFYPHCFPSDHTEPSIPVQVHIGSADEWTPARYCRGMYEGLFKKYKYGEYYEYPNVHHGFDMYGVDRTAPGLGLHGIIANKRLKYDGDTTKIAYERTIKFFKD